ncbi:MAG: hypothetical protein M3Y91_18780 [Actinomycetota bacterium]|nr:hypothetical protein [Actinomycetota bacterium]
MTWTGPTPTQLLAAARTTLDRTDGWGSSWPRAAAFLARQALEDGVDTLWTGTTAGLHDSSMSAQLTCLPFYLADPDLAHRTRQCWHALSTACHAHPYELAPTVAELAGWFAVVDELLAHLRATVAV